MANLSITTAWNETAAFVQREARLLFPIAFLLIALPGAMLQALMPAAGARPAARSPAPGSLLIPVLILASMIGKLAISYLALGRHLGRRGAAASARAASCRCSARRC